MDKRQSVGGRAFHKHVSKHQKDRLYTELIKHVLEHTLLHMSDNCMVKEDQ